MCDGLCLTSFSSTSQNAFEVHPCISTYLYLILFIGENILLYFIKLCECVKSPQWCLTLCNPMGCSPPGSPLCPWDSPGKNTGVDCHFLRQRIFPTQGLNPLHLLCLLHWYNFICVCVCVCVCVCMYMCICVYICVYICMCVYIYIYTHIYTYIYM